MSKKYIESSLELVGKTPLLKLNGYSKKAGITNANTENKINNNFFTYFCPLFSCCRGLGFFVNNPPFAVR